MRQAVVQISHGTFLSEYLPQVSPPSQKEAVKSKFCDMQVSTKYLAMIWAQTL